MQQQLVMTLAMGCIQLAVRLDRLLSDTLILTGLLLLVIPLWLVFVCCSPRPLQSTTTTTTAPTTSSGIQNKILLGQPRLLATQVSHTRLGSGHYNYTVPHFLVGTPLGLQGRIGSVLSLDEETKTGTNQTVGLWQYLKSKTWFTIHAHHHLEKGNDSVGLQGKLHEFLLSQGQNPDEWPFAYLVSMPQFLGYQRNLVCFWYLYSASRELTAMIMEVNNYWGQRKIAFTRLTGESPLPPSVLSSISSEMSSAPASTPPVSFHHSNPRHLSYRGTWDKDMFISPFEKVEGSIALRLSDPLGPSDAPLHITITLLSPSGKPRLIGRVFCPQEHDYIDPLTASSWQMLRFLPYWTGVLVITEWLIIAAALYIRSKRAIDFFSMPEVRPNNLPRDESSIERGLEAPFRHYLEHLVANFPSPLQLRYLPAKSHHLQPVTFTSPLGTTTPNTPIITLQVLTPQFYTSFPAYQDPILAFTEESRLYPLPSDPSSRRLIISDPALFFHLLSSSSSSPSIQTQTQPTRKASLITKLRGTPTQPFMDRFVSSYLSPSAQKEYQSALLTHLLADRFALGLHGLLAFYVTVAYLGVQAGLSYLLFSVWSGVFGSAIDGLLAMFCHWCILRGVVFC